MRAILDALSLSVVLLVLPWIFIQVGIGAALAWRHGLAPVVGAACGLIPVPFLGWVVVIAVARRGLTGSDEGSGSIGGPSSRRTVTAADDDGW